MRRQQQLSSSPWQNVLNAGEIFSAMRSLNETSNFLRRQQRTVTIHNQALTKYRKLNNKLRENQYQEAQRERDRLLQEGQQEGVDAEGGRSAGSVGGHIRMNSMAKLTSENEDFLDSLVAEINQLAKIEKLRKQARNIACGPRSKSEMVDPSGYLNVKGLNQ